jgi:hypothetical protein
MAIFSSVPPPAQQPATGSGVDIEAWTVAALESLSISPSAVGTGVTLSIPLDARDEKDDTPKHLRPSKLLSRDSQKRREALLKGKEGSRRRQRWENGM